MGNICEKPLYKDKDIIVSNKSQNDSPREKKKIKEIEEIKKEIMDIPIFERKENAELNYEDYLINKKMDKKEKDFFEEYIEIIKLLLLDETNKGIVKLYLKFIKNNETLVKNYGFSTFNEEIKKYKLLFTIDEMKKIAPEIKKKSEKEKFIYFLKKISTIQTISDINRLYNEIDQISKSIEYFNYPIEFSNQELFYYKLYVLLLMGIKKVKDNILYSNNIKNNYILNRSAVANLVIDKKIFENEEIINNEDKMNILIILILFDKLDDKKESVNFNRLLQTEPVKFDKLNNFIIENKLGEITMTDEKSRLILKNRFGFSEMIVLDCNHVCLNNLNKPQLDYKMNINIFNTLDSLFKDNNIIPYIERIKLFLITIVTSKVYKEAISKLFPNHNKYLLGTHLKDIKTCINERFKFYPYQDLGDSGLTDKFSCYTYIPILIFDLTVKIPIFCFTVIIGAIIENSIHEINHLNQDIIYFKGNDKNLFLSPKRENLKGEDGGENLEEIFFGKRIKNLKILECFYILNENNYNQSLNDFKKNFENLYNNNVDFSEKINYLKNTEVNAIFKEFFDNIKGYKKNDFLKIELFGINTKKNEADNKEAMIKISREHCKVGF